MKKEIIKFHKQLKKDIDEQIKYMEDNDMTEDKADMEFTYEQFKMLRSIL